MIVLLDSLQVTNRDGCLPVTPTGCETIEWLREAYAGQSGLLLGRWLSLAKLTPGHCAIVLHAVRTNRCIVMVPKLCSTPIRMTERWDAENNEFMCASHHLY